MACALKLTLQTLKLSRRWNSGDIRGSWPQSNTVSVAGGVPRLTNASILFFSVTWSVSLVGKVIRRGDLATRKPELSSQKQRNGCGQQELKVNQLGTFSFDQTDRPEIYTRSASTATGRPPSRVSTRKRWSPPVPLHFRLIASASAPDPHCTTVTRPMPFRPEIF